MKKTTTITTMDSKESACKNCATQKPFYCPRVMMADTCEDCSMFSSDGRCRKWGGYVDADKWACSWYYEN